MASNGNMRSRWLTESETDRLAQIIQRYFIKSAYIIVSYRSERFESHAEFTKDDLINKLGLDFFDNFFDNHVDKYFDNHFDRGITTNTDLRTRNHSQIQPQCSWFQVTKSSLEAPLSGVLEPWNNKNVTLLPPMIVETVLDLSGFSEEEQLYIDTDMVSFKKKTEIVLERWLIKLDLNTYDIDSNNMDTIYNQVIVLIRCLYSLLGVLPITNLTDHNITKHIKTKILNGSKSITSKGRYGLSRSLIPLKPENDVVKSKDLSPVLTPIGSLKLSVSYRKNCNYHIYENREADTNSLADSDLQKNRSSPKEISKFVSPVNLGNIKFRTSNSSINSQNLKRRPSGRSVSIFKTGSIASSASPPVHTTTMASTTPIPVQRVDSFSNVHFMSHTERQDSIGSGYGMVTSTSNKLPSSYGSRFKSNTSRNNSIEINPNTATPNPTVLLHSTKNKSRLNSTISNELEPPGSIDDDLSHFMRLLESKPDLRVSNSSSLLYEDSINNFKNLRRQNDMFTESPLRNSPIIPRSRSISPPQPPPLVGDMNSLDSAVKLLLDSKLGHKTTNQTNRSVSSTPVHLSFMNNSSTSHYGTGHFERNDSFLVRARAASKGSKDSRESRGSRDSQASRNSTSMAHGPLIVSSYSPGSIFGQPTVTHNPSLHSMLKANAVSEASMVPVTATNMNKECSISASDNVNTTIYPTASNNSHFSLFSESKFYNSNRTASCDANVNCPVSPFSNVQHPFSLPGNFDQPSINSNWNSPPSRAQSLLRSLSIGGSGGGGTAPDIPKSRTGSGGSISGSSNLRSILQKGLKSDSHRQYSKLGSNSYKNELVREYTPDQLKNIAYGRQVFDSDNEDDDSLNEVTPSEVQNTSTRFGDHKLQRRSSTKGKKESLANVLSNMKNIQRRRSSVIGPAVLRSKFKDFENESENDAHAESEDEEDDDLLFEMTDMNSIKQ